MGSNIGILNTIVITLLTAIVGIFFVKRQGLNLLFNAQRNMAQGIMPTEEIKGGIFLLISGFSNFLHGLQSVEENSRVQGFLDFPASAAGWPKSRLWEGGFNKVGGLFSILVMPVPRHFNDGHQSMMIINQ